jgi:hypothetical protein
MEIIATWIHIDAEGEESKYPQVSGKSSNLEFQRTYWECIIVFFASSLRFNKDKKHILFTNTDIIPILDDFNIKNFLSKNNVEIILVTNKYKVPKGYFESWNNQFYEFSILDYLSHNITKPYLILMLDSDCVFNAPVDYLFKELKFSRHPAFTYTIDYPEKYDINGLNRIEMQTIFNELGLECNTPPKYSGGEVLFAKSDFIENLCKDFNKLWNDLISRFENRCLKFNEEAHTLSYYYYKYDADLGKLNGNIKRCWTNPFSYINIRQEDLYLDILHLPSEKKVGIRKIYRLIAHRGIDIQNLNELKYKKLITDILYSKKYHFNFKNLASFLFRKLKTFVNA